MDEQSAIEIVKTVERDLLTVRERSAMEALRALNQPGLSPHTQAKLFALFLQGIPCVEIARLNPGIALGQIVIARLEGNWDEKKQEHIETLLREARARLQQTALESASFVSIQLAATHKQYGDAALKYIQSGDPADLGNFSIHGWRQYREAQDLLKVITGTDKTSKVLGEVTHKHEVVDGPAVPVNRAMTPEEARDARQKLLEARKGK